MAAQALVPEKRPACVHLRIVRNPGPILYIIRTLFWRSAVTQDAPAAKFPAGSPLSQFGSADYSMPSTFTMTRLRRWPSNSA